MVKVMGATLESAYHKDSCGLSERNYSSTCENVRKNLFKITAIRERLYNKRERLNSVSNIAKTAGDLNSFNLSDFLLCYQMGKLCF